MASINGLLTKSENYFLTFQTHGAFSKVSHCMIDKWVAKKTQTRKKENYTTLNPHQLNIKSSPTNIKSSPTKTNFQLLNVCISVNETYKIRHQLTNFQLLNVCNSVNETYKIQVCGHIKKLKCFQTKMIRKMRLLIGLCRLHGSLNSFLESKYKIPNGNIYELNTEKKY